MATVVVTAWLLTDGAGASRAARLAAAERTVWDRYGTGLAAGSGEAPGEPQAIADMIAHHRDAIDGSLAFLAHADPASPTARFAERVVRVQREQVAQMEGWLHEWYPDAHPVSGWWPMFSDPNTSADAASYLWVMTAHHEHAISMYAGWIADGIVVHDELGILASRIAKGQEGEIARMAQLAASSAS